MHLQSMLLRRDGRGRAQDTYFTDVTCGGGMALESMAVVQLSNLYASSWFIC